jgi:uridine kinase
MNDKKEEDMKELHDATRSVSAHVFGRPMPLAVCVTGPTCSGKSTLAQALTEDQFLKSYHCGIIKLDDYMRNADDSMMPKQEGKPVYDHPQAYHGSEFASHIRILMQGRSVASPTYDAKTNRRTSQTRLIKPPDILIAEGLFVFELTRYLTISRTLVYLDVPEQVCLQRRIERDCKLYGVSPEKVENVFRTRVWPSYAPFGKSQKETADIIV